MACMARLAPCLAFAAALLAGCSGGDPVLERQPAPPAATTDAGPGSPTTLPTLTGAKIRLVNLYLPPEGQPEKVDVYAGIAIGEEVAGEPIHTLGLGESTEYFEPPATTDGSSAVLSFFPEGVKAVDDLLINFEQTMADGDQWTVVLSRGTERSDGKPPFGFQTIGDKAAASGQAAVPEPGAGKGQVIGFGGALVNLLGQEDNSFTFGVPGKGCLTPADPAMQGVNVGGTSVVPFDVDPGTVEVAAYDAVDVECSGKAEIGPVDVEVTEGRRTYVFTFTRSEDPSDRELLVLPTE